MKIKEILYKSRKFLVWACLAALIPISLYCAFGLRFDGVIKGEEVSHLVIAVLLALPIKLAAARCWGLHLGWGSMMTKDDVLRISLSQFVANSVIAVAARRSHGRFT
jgi:hypothetical protein